MPESVYNVCSLIIDKSPNDLASQFTRNKLAEMFEILYDIKPRASLSKLDLAWKLRDYVESLKRTNDLVKILQ